MERRRFLKGLTAAGTFASLAPAHAGAAFADTGSQPGQESALPRASSPGTLKGDMLYRPLGRTGETVSAIGLGGSHIAKPPLTESESIRLVQAAIDRGITFMDNAWDCNQGESEMRMGKALAQGGYRNRVFLMTKIDGRDREEAMSQIDMSLKRLRTDHIDLLQHHEVIRFEDPDRIFAQAGATEACLAAKKAGKIRFIGFTGHKDPHVHLYMLATAAQHDFHFDTAQMPLNLMDAHFRSFAQLVVPKLVSEGIGVLGMKPMGGGDGIVLKSHTVTPIECLHYALNLPTSVVITGIDKPEVLNQAFEAARTFSLLSESQLAELTAKTAPVAGAGAYELYKTSSHFDSTAHHPDWLGGETPGVYDLAPQSAG
jgi:aryl-alcohol dehydrogenase-like predicted oxidoreductase